MRVLTHCCTLAWTRPPPPPQYRKYNNPYWIAPMWLSGDSNKQPLAMLYGEHVRALLR